MGCWNTTNYGGRHTLDLNEMGHIWQNYYLKNIKDLTDAQARTTDDDEKVNINAAVRIYRVYLMSHLTDIYGDVPYFEAGKALLMVSSRLDMTRKKRYTMTFLRNSTLP